MAQRPWLGDLRTALDLMKQGQPQNCIDALEKLSPKLREVLVLAVHQGLAYDEIARILHIPPGTVKSRVFNALGTLQEMYHEDHT